MTDPTPCKLTFVLALAAVAGGATASYATSPEPASSCRQNKERESAASLELQKLSSEDQADRPNNAMKPGADERDRERRKRVGELFGEGCLRTAADFAAAALVFQHGEVPEHFFQTYVWAKRAVELGDESQKRLMAMGVDRYLVNTGRKQLFGTQAYKLDGARCWCLRAVESTFPEKLRRDHIGATLKEKLAWADSLNKEPGCPKENICVEKPPLKDSQAGTIPGLW